MVMTINLMYLIYFLIFWFGSGAIAIPLFYLTLKINKVKMSLDFYQLTRAIILGPIGLTIVIYEFIKMSIDLMLGKKVWIVNSKEGKVPFKYKDVMSEAISPYVLSCATEVIELKKKLIYRSTFIETHPSYFKLIYKKGRIKK